MTVFQEKKFCELDLFELHDIYALRAEVFVVEQNCVYQDIDGKDKKAHHILGKINGELVAYARLLEKGISYPSHVSIGRIVIAKRERGKSLGKELVRFCLLCLAEQYPQHPIKISAQSHLEDFYNQHGFSKTGSSYLEDGIPHIAMIKAAP